MGRKGACLSKMQKQETQKGKKQTGADFERDRQALARHPTSKAPQGMQVMASGALLLRSPSFEGMPGSRNLFHSPVSPILTVQIRSNPRKFSNPHQPGLR